jgi:NADPH-dependent 2,4-dienoyl-CoA reductase/sulfur reductase-like enzyme/rhodanese-related sulfurtransferase
MAKRKIVILGGALSGPTAAAHARETDTSAQITLLERAKAISYAVGGLPYFLSGEIVARSDIAPYGADFFRHDYDVEVRTSVSIERFDPQKRKVYTSEGIVPYDTLIYALGAGSVMPPVFGEGAANLSFLRNPAHLETIDSILRKGAKRVAIVGGGYYGVEAADCLARRGLEVHLLERGPQLLPEFSAEAAERAAQALRERGVDVRLHTEIDAVKRKGKQIVVLGLNGEPLATDLILVTAGVRPRTEIFVEAGGKVADNGSIEVDDRCATNLDNVFATSICVSHRHAVTGKHVWTAQASDADKTAQVAGTNAAGGDAKLGPTLGTAILRAGDLHLARTGLTQIGGKLDHKLDVARIRLSGHSCDPFFRGSEPLELTLYHTRDSERIVGAEIIGRAGVDKRIDVLATAVLAKLNLEQLAQLDLAYSPPYSMTRDIINAAGVVGRQAKHVQVWEPADFTAREETTLVYDLRDKAERKAHPVDAVAMDLEELRKHATALRKAKAVVFVCETGRTSYLAARTAAQLGCKGAGYLSGGLRAWRAATLER